MSELKPCPFCGSPVRWSRSLGEVECRNVDCMVTVRSQFRDAWNRRAPSPAVRALVEACRAIYHDEYFCEGMTLVQSGKILDMLTRLAAVEREIGGV